MPSVMAMITQPAVSSITAAATMSWPTLRRMKFISRTTVATILSEEIESAVPRNSAATRRLPASGSRASGSSMPTAKPRTNGTAMPLSDTLSACVRSRQASPRSVSMPASSSRNRMPSCEMPLIMACCSGSTGRCSCSAPGATAAEDRRPKNDAGKDLPDDAWLAKPKHHLAQQAPEQHQQHYLHQKQCLRPGARGRFGGDTRRRPPGN